MTASRLSVFIFAFVAFLSACAVEKTPAPPPAPAQPPAPPLAQPQSLVLEPASFAGLSGWMSDRHGSALAAFRRSCPRLVRNAPQPQSFGIGGAWNWTAICQAASQVPVNDNARARAFFERWFEPRRMTNSGNARGLVTGYYEPELKGALKQSAATPVPLYKRPDDLVTVDLGQFDSAFGNRTLAGRIVDGALRPYPTRAEIDRGALKGRGLELVWLANAIDAFVLHVQGSGRVMLPDGKSVRVGFAGHNGQEYVAIGRELIREGAIPADQVTMPAIRAWLERNPEKAAGMMARNPRYVFFRILPSAPDDGLGPIGPEGAMGVPLSAERSIAVDRAFVPLGLPVWLDAPDPRNAGRLSRLVVAQDTGGAIKGPVRADFFWGSGAAAEAAAGAMKSEGNLWLLLPKVQP